MLNLKFIQENPELVIAKLKKKQSFGCVDYVMKRMLRLSKVAFNLSTTMPAFVVITCIKSECLESDVHDTNLWFDYFFDLLF